jgi:hypothetical protein
MQRFEKVAEALKQFPASIWGEPAWRSWNPDEQTKCITAFKVELDRLQKLIEAISALAEYGYPLAEISSCIGASIMVEQKVPHQPTVTATINEGLIEKIKRYMVLSPEVEHPPDVQILCVMEATAEYLTNRIIEESKFLEHITEEIGTETEKNDKKVD